MLDLELALRIIVSVNYDSDLKFQENKMEYLDKINTPQDVKKLDKKELNVLAEEVRNAILNKVSKVGGHIGPNLGMVETTIALHYVFNSPKDKFVFDVSHQSYPHKILTGRKNAFLYDEEMETVSGYTNPEESEHDFFVVGHTSTSVSLACGLAKARDIKGEENNIVAIIGDGSLSGGEALEGFSYAAELNSNIIIIVNDNDMSIAENHGGIYKNLRLLRETNGQAECNMFKAWGFDYHYLEEGNSVEQLVEMFDKVKDTKKPTVLHIHTTKGKGYKFAEADKETWHWNMPFSLETGKLKTDYGYVENYNDLTADYLIEKVSKDKNIVVVNAGTPAAVGLTPEKRKTLGQNFVDVGIAEEHAVAMSSALAKGGCKPVYMVLSPFIQRTYDQLSHDLAINNNPAVILVFWNGISGGDVTHLGSFDIPLISNIPNIVYLAPTTKEEYFAMLDWGVEQKNHPVVIRVPSRVVSVSATVDKCYDRLNHYQTVKEGKDVAVLALGSFFGLGEQVVEHLKEKGFEASLINPRFISGLDEALLSELKKNHELVITLEDGELDGGFGEKIARFYGTSDVKVLNFGAKKEFTDRVPLAELYERYHLTPELIVNDILNVL